MEACRHTNELSRTVNLSQIPSNDIDETTHSALGCGVEEAQKVLSILIPFNVILVFLDLELDLVRRQSSIEQR
jgi:hypothetical protein